MRFVEPRVIRLAQTELCWGNVREDFLPAVGVPEFSRQLDAASDDGAADGELLIELAGRLCYRSFAPGLNPNVTKVREGNAGYLANLLKQRHYSVLEHVNVTYAFLNVSRVFTHELVRHRLASFSQESLRYVRLTDLGAYWPEAFGEEVVRQIVNALKHSDASWDEAETDVEQMLEQSRDLFRGFFEHAEHVQSALAELFQLDDLTDFDLKKRITSAMRRCAPIGLTTAVIMTANLREWRHVVELRTSEHAEEEIRKVIGLVASDLRELYPSAMKE